MAYPPAYTRTFSFTNFESTNPGEPKPGDKLDTEYNNVSNALTATQDNLALIQRADGALSNDSVGVDQLQDDVFDGIVDGVTADAEAAADAASASASLAAGSAAAADMHADAAATSAGEAAGAAAQAGTSQSIAQNAANEAVISADESADSALNSQQAANDTAGSVAECEAHVQRAFEWAELLTGPVLPADPGWPEAVDDGMFSAKWWAIRAREYNSVTTIDLGDGQADIGDAWDEWDAIPGNDAPLGLVYATWGDPEQVYILTDPNNPSDPASWTSITGPAGPAGPAIIDLTAAYTWTGQHTFSADPEAPIRIYSPYPQLLWRAGASPVDNRLWDMWIQDETFGLSAHNDTGTTGGSVFEAHRVLNEIDTLTFWPTLAIFNGAVRMANPAGTDYATFSHDGNVFNTVLTSTNRWKVSGAPSYDFWGGVNGHAALGVNVEATGTARNGVLYVWHEENNRYLEMGIEGSASATDSHWIYFASALGPFSIGGDNGTFLDFTDVATVPLTTLVSGANIAGLLQANGVEGLNGQVLASQGAGLPPIWRTAGSGSIDMTFKFVTAVGGADPGNQDMAMNSAVYSAVTSIVFDEQTSTNFEAATILSLLRAGNRIYLQQSDDSTKAAVYEVTAPATDNGTYWSVPVSFIAQGSSSAMFAASKVITAVFILSSSSASVANPTGTVGLTAVNGSATTAMRSDAAPALSQAIVPTWTGIHTFSSASPEVRFQETDQSVNEQFWRIRAETKVMSFQAANDAFSTTRSFLTITRGGLQALTDITFGNVNDAVTFNFLGAGLTTFTGIVRVPQGSATAPSYSFTGDTGMGLYRVGANNMGVAIGGANVATFGAGIVTLAINIRGVDGTVTNPAWTFSGDINTGLYAAAADRLGITTGGVARVLVDNTFFETTVPIGAPAATAAAPAFYFSADPDTGIYRAAADTIGIATGGVVRLGISTAIATFTLPLEAPSFTSTSSRAIKRETGAPSKVSDILSRLRPILYRLLAGDDREQIGLIAEEVHEVCPQLSDGKTVSYDRLALLLLAAWQEQNVAAA